MKLGLPNAESRSGTPIGSVELVKAEEDANWSGNEVKAPSTLTLCRRAPKGRGHMECGGKRSATPLWLTLRGQVSAKPVAERSQSAVVANALPAHSKGPRAYGVRREAERHAALADVTEASQPEAGCGTKSERRRR